MKADMKLVRWRPALGAAMLAAIFALLPGAVRAEPQALGLVATRDATPLQCAAGVCTGFFSTFCLEEERKPPSSRAAYRPTADSDITLIVETADGRTVRLPGQDYLAFRTRLDFTSMLVSVAESRLAAFSPVRISVSVGTLASLVPVPTGVDPHQPEQLALATGPYRRAGQGFFDNGGETGETVALVTRLINIAPRRGRMTKAGRAAAYGAVVAAADGRAARDGARARFQSVVKNCERMLEATAERFNLRQCLEYRHGVIQTRTNRAFWKSLGGV